MDVKWKFLCTDEDGDAFGTNDEALARRAAWEWQTHSSVNTEAGMVLGETPEQDYEVPELKDDDEEDDSDA